MSSHLKPMDGLLMSVNKFQKETNFHWEIIFIIHFCRQDRKKKPNLDQIYHN